MKYAYLSIGWKRFWDFSMEFPLNSIIADATHVRLKIYVQQTNTSHHRVISSHRTQNNENNNNNNEHLLVILYEILMRKKENTYNAEVKRLLSNPLLELINLIKL